MEGHQVTYEAFVRVDTVPHVLRDGPQLGVGDVRYIRCWSLSAYSMIICTY